MSFLLTETLPTGYNPTLQPFVRDGATVGSALTPTVVGNLHTWDLSGLAAGDYDMQLGGDWEIDGPKFPLRKTATAIYYADFWWQLDAAITTPPTYPPIQVGVCNILVTATLNGDPVNNARVEASLEDPNNAVDEVIASRAVETIRTNASGNGFLTLIKYSEFTSGGIYRVKIWDGRVVIWDVRIKVPDLDECTLESLPNDTTGRS